MGEPARERRRRPDAFPGHPPLRVVGAGGEREDLVLSHPPPTPPPHHRARTRARLRLSERALAGWLRRRLGTVGAEAMVRKHGARAVLEALYDNVAIADPMVAGGVRVNPELRNPGGYLRWVLDEEAGR